MEWALGAEVHNAKSMVYLITFARILADAAPAAGFQGVENLTRACIIHAVRDARNVSYSRALFATAPKTCCSSAERETELFVVHPAHVRSGTGPTWSHARATWLRGSGMGPPPMTQLRP